MSNTTIEPELIDSMKTELSAVNSGHGPIHDELREDLGRFSMSASGIEDTRAEIERADANYKLLLNFGKLLPRINSRKGDEQYFVLDGPDKQYTSRQIQANVIWEYGNPYFIIGRQEDPDEANSVNLLLLSASAQAGDRIELIKVRKDDMRIRDQLVANLQDDEFTEEEISQMVDPITAKFKLGSDTRGNISLDINWLGPKRDLKNVEAQGVRRTSDDRHDVNFHGTGKVPSGVMKQLHVDTTLAKLATAFHITDEFNSLLDGKVESTSSTQEKLEEALRQNRELKDELANILNSTGLVGRGRVQEILDERFPDIEV